MFLGDSSERDKPKLNNGSKPSEHTSVTIT
jgi:hypothetical protein